MAVALGNFLSVITELLFVKDMNLKMFSKATQKLWEQVLGQRANVSSDRGWSRKVKSQVLDEISEGKNLAS